MEKILLETRGAPLITFSTAPPYKIRMTFLITQHSSTLPCPVREFRKERKSDVTTDRPELPFP